MHDITENTALDVDQHYEPGMTLEEVGALAGLTRERVRQLLPAFAATARSVRYLDKALEIVRSEEQSAVVQIGLGEYAAGKALWCEDCGRRIRGEGREVGAHTSMALCSRCAVARFGGMAQARWHRRARPPQGRWAVTCSGITKTGHSCTQPPQVDSDRCRWH